MKYHAIPAPRRLTKEVDRSIRHAINRLVHELIDTLAKLKKRSDLDCPVLFYLHDHDSMSDLMHRLIAGDELIVHAEGFPFIIGPVESGPYMLTPFQLASLLDENRLPDLDINIHLLSCNSATEYYGNNFSSDTSKALHLFFRYQSISVTGFTGFIEVKSNAKYAVSSVLGRSTKGTHSDLESAKVVYKNGQVCFSNRILIKTLSNMSFSWAENHIKQTNLERKLIDVIQKGDDKVSVTHRVASVDTFFKNSRFDEQDSETKKRSNSHHFFP